MGRRGTTVVAWMIGLGALGAQAVVVPIASAMLQDRESVPVQVTAPALPPAPPVLRKVGPAHEPCDRDRDEGLPKVQVIALVG